MFRKLILFVFFLLLVLYQSNGQELFTFEISLDWEEEQFEHPLSGKSEIISTFEDAYFNESHHTLATFGKRFILPSNGRVEAVISNAVFESFEKNPHPQDDYLADRISINNIVEQERQSFYANIFFIPIIKNRTGYERLSNFTLTVRFFPAVELPISINPRSIEKSQLSDGDLYKMYIPKEGIYKLDFSFFQSIEGLDPASFDPRNVKILGNEGGLLPERIATNRIDDLVELPIFFSGEEDGVFNTQDYMLFYAEGPTKMHFNEAEERFYIDHNYYDDYNHYFIKISPENGKRISSIPSLNSTAFSDDNYDDCQRFDEDLFNLLGDLPSAPGSGKRWYGQKFIGGNAVAYQDKFDLEHIIVPGSMYVEMEFASRSQSPSQVILKLDDQSINTSFPAQDFSDEYNNFANNRKLSGPFTIDNDSPNLVVDYPGGATTSEGWIDYLQINVQRKLIFNGSWMDFRNISTRHYATSTLSIENASSAQIWDVTDIENIVQIETEKNGNALSFGFDSEKLRTFVALNPNGSFPAPESVEPVPNQNLHGITELDLLIIYFDDFKESAEKLAQHRSNNDNLITYSIPISQVYNEFSGGSEDLTAIRDFARMLHKRSDRFKYLLLLGDGSFDYKHIKKTYNDENLVPVYQTYNSLHPINAYPSDDYYALLSDNEGANLKGALDIAVGRLPVRTEDEAMLVVDKIIDYETNAVSLGDWRLRLGFLADDEDHNDHAEQADDIANLVKNKFEAFNIEKIYFDAYKQASFSGGERFPDANKAINDNMFRGWLAINYLGHGGPNGWAQERVLLVDDINSWTNQEKLPLFVTATCTFTGFDDPTITSAGEYTLLNENGGTIALFSTVRAVISAYNKRLAENVFDTMFAAKDGQYQRLGEVLQSAKNIKADTSGGNARKFLMIGDPSMRLSIPSYNIEITKINEKEVGPSNIDTLSAFDRGSIEGIVTDKTGAYLPNFNGLIYTSIFDKEKTVQTLGQDPKSQPPLPYKIRKNIIFKGVSSIENGKFNIEFIVPKDIDYSIGNAKISLYAKSDQQEDAAGASFDLKIGGSSNSSINDDQGPVIDLFMNDESFVWGGMTNRDPILLVKLKDDFGINITGNSIGHDLIAILDNNNKNTYILNDYFEGAVNDFTAGTVRFPLNDLDTGWHEITVRAWDIANNTSESRIRFYVNDDENLQIKHAYNYPNPFGQQTEFMFEHNLGATDFNAQIQIFTVSGRLVKTIHQYVNSTGYRVSGINWDGKDEFDNPLANGVYLYKIKIQTFDDLAGNKSIQSPFEKLVILK